MTIRASTAEYDGVSITSHALAIRSVVDCTFGPVTSIGGNHGALQIQQYSGHNDAGYVVSRMDIEAVLHVTGTTGASVASIVCCASAASGALDRVSVGSLNGSCGVEVGLFIRYGQLGSGQS